MNWDGNKYFSIEYQWTGLRDHGKRERRQNLGKYREKYRENGIYGHVEENVLPPYKNHSHLLLKSEEEMLQSNYIIA